MADQTASRAPAASVVLDRNIATGFTSLWPVSIAAFVGLKFALLCMLAWHGQFIMDEYWLVGDARRLNEALYQEVWPYKNQLYAVVFALAHLVGDSAVAIMRWARIEMVAIAVAGLILLFSVSRRATQSNVAAIAAVTLTLCFSSYMERVFLTRPEPIALTLTLVALWITLRSGPNHRMLFLAGIFAGLAFLTTQKAVYFNLALGFGLVGDAVLRRRLGKGVIDGGLLVSGWMAAVAVYAWVFWLRGAAPGDVLHQMFTGPVPNALEGHKVYSSMSSFLTRTFEQNALLYVFCAAGWLAAARDLLAMPGPRRILWIFSGVIVTLVYAHRAPWPYNFVMAIPFLAIWGGDAVRRLANWRNQLARPGRLDAVVTVVAAILVTISVARNVYFLGNDNAKQNQAVTIAESALTPDQRYADGIGMVVSRDRAGADIWWSRSELLATRNRVESGDSSSLDTVFDDQPKVFIKTYRSEVIADLLERYLAKSYIAIAGNVLVAGATLTGGMPTEFRAPWSGSYRVVDAQGVPNSNVLFVDGSAVVPPFELPIGVTELWAPENETLHVIPADVQPGAIENEPRPDVLFYRAHSY